MKSEEQYEHPKNRKKKKKMTVATATDVQQENNRIEKN